MAYRSVAYVQLAELALASGDYDETSRYARLAMTYDGYSLPAREVLAIVGRKTGDAALASSMRDEISRIDPLSHFPNTEVFLAARESGGAVPFADFRSEYPDQTLLELAASYYRRGCPDEALRLLNAGAAMYANPLIKLWQAYLSANPAMLASVAAPTLVFPYRLETLQALEWAVRHNDHWAWSYLFALNLWALDRVNEAAERLDALGNTPEFAPAYVSRAVLLARVLDRDPESDFRRAVRLDESSRTIRIHLIRYLHEQGRWEDALAESALGLEMFPGDFNLDLLHVRALNNLGRPDEAIEILANTRVLPSENARESHRLYEQAHILAALDALDNGDYDGARDLLLAALEWPEHLGQGRPYDPEERVVRFLLAQVHSRAGRADQAREAYDAVVGNEEVVAVGANRLELLTIPALAELRGVDQLSALAIDERTQVGRLASRLVAAYTEGGDVDATILEMAVEHSNMFQDLDGSILLRALTNVSFGGGGR